MKIKEMPKEQQREVVLLLKKLDIKPFYKGYEYIKTALFIMIPNVDLRFRQFSTNIFPMIAKKYGSKTKGVERSIRFVIEKTFDENKMPLLFKDATYRPTITEFLFSCIDKLEFDKLEKEVG